jgi:uncharacterized protein DUF5701
VGDLVEKGYPALAGLDETAFRRRISPLRTRLADVPVGRKGGQIPFVIVVTGLHAPWDRAIGLVSVRGKTGFTEMPADDLGRFHPIDSLELPGGSAYVMTGVDTGAATLNVTPDDALATITAAGRSPLTIDEGMALLTSFPNVLVTHNAFSMLGSRCGDRRVTAMWLSRGRPRLGWCWAGNPHTWLGSASCEARLGA